MYSVLKLCVHHKVGLSNVLQFTAILIILVIFIVLICIYLFLSCIDQGGYDSYQGGDAFGHDDNRIQEEKKGSGPVGYSDKAQLLGDGEEKQGVWGNCNIQPTTSP